MVTAAPASWVLASQSTTFRGGAELPGTTSSSPSPHTAGQGSLTWECAVEEVLRFLDERGIEAFYEPGHMD